MSYLQNAGSFLITSLFGFAICVFLIRTLLIAVGAPFNEPVCRFVYAVTNRVITPLRTIVPRWRRVELASVLVAWLLALLQLVLLTALFGVSLSFVGLLLRSLVDTLDWLILIELAAIIVFCVLSFFPAVRYDSNFRLLMQFIDPVVRPFRRLLPPMGGFDFSCWLATVVLILLRMLLIAPLADFAAHLR